MFLKLTDPKPNLKENILSNRIEWELVTFWGVKKNLKKNKKNNHFLSQCITINNFKNNKNREIRRDVR